MEKSLYECSFYLKDEKGNKKTEYLTTYFETEYSRYAENLLIATFANGNRDRIFFPSPQTVRDKETLLKKEMVFVLFQFQLGDENGKRMNTTFNYFFTDIIMAKDYHKAEMLLNAKYGQGNPKRILNRTSRTYRYDELRNIPSNYETYEFTFYLKNEKGNKCSEMMTMQVDDISYWKAEEKMIAMLANGDKNRVWHSSGKTIGPALPTELRKQYDIDRENERIQKEKKRQEEWNKKIEERRKEREELNQKIEDQRKARNSARASQVLSTSKAQTKEKIKVSRSEINEVKGILDEDEYEIVEDDPIDYSSQFQASTTGKKHPVQNVLVFLISGFCIAAILGASKIIKNDLLVFAVAAGCSLLLFAIRKRCKLKLWFPAKLGLLLFVIYIIYDCLK